MLHPGSHEVRIDSPVTEGAQSDQAATTFAAVVREDEVELCQLIGLGPEMRAYSMSGWEGLFPSQCSAQFRIASKARRSEAGVKYVVCELDP